MVYETMQLQRTVNVQANSYAIYIQLWDQKCYRLVIIKGILQY